MKLLLLAALFTLAYATVQYNNFTVYRVIPQNVFQLNILKKLEHNNINEYDFWKSSTQVGNPVDIMVSPEKQVEFKTFLHNHHLDFTIMVEDVQKLIETEQRVNTEIKAKAVDFDWTSYHTLAEINEWLLQLTKDYPGVVTLVKGGESYEGRDLTGVKVTYGNPKPTARRTVWIDSLIHAREWIAGATSTYILNEILTSKNETIRTLAESHDWYFFPAINPDGYEYTKTNRLWRKTRSPQGLDCYGVDPNRNWGYRWNTGGASSNPCNDAYAGPSEFSEIETKSLSEFMSNVAGELELFITFHSYSQLILLPYGHTTEHLDNYNVTYPVGLEAAAALKQRYGTIYKVGNIAETIYEATGSNMDWLKAYYQVPFCYCLELRDTGAHGFLLPPKQIIPTGQETLDAVIVMLQRADEIEK